MSRSKPVVFFGTEDFSLGTLKALVEAGFSVATVVTKPDAPKGRGHRLVAPAVKTYADEHGIPVLQPTKLTEITDHIMALDSPIGVLVSYGKIIPEPILSLFTPGIVNLHPSLLPKYRGPSPIESAILASELETGVSIMRLSAAMDAGPIYQQAKVSLNGRETAEELYDQLGTLGTQVLVDILPSIMDGSLVPTDQNDDDATYCNILKKSDGIISWTNEAAKIDAQIRAYHLWPQTRTTIGDMEIILTKTEVLNERYGEPGHIELHPDNTLSIDTGTTALRIMSLKPVGKKEMPVEAFLAGYRLQADL